MLREHVNRVQFPDWPGFFLIQEICVQDLQANEGNLFGGGARRINRIIFIFNIKYEPLRGQ